MNLDTPVSSPALRRFLLRYGIQGSSLQHHVRDPKYIAARLFGVKSYPSTVFLNAKGQIAYYLQGTIPDHQIERILHQLGI